MIIEITDLPPGAVLSGVHVDISFAPGALGALGAPCSTDPGTVRVSTHVPVKIDQPGATEPGATEPSATEPSATEPSATPDRSERAAIPNEMTNLEL